MFSYRRKSQAKTQVVFQAKTQANVFPLNCHPGTSGSKDTSSTSSMIPPQLESPAMTMWYTPLGVQIISDTLGQKLYLYWSSLSMCPSFKDLNMY